MIELDLPYPLMDQGNGSTPKEMIDCDIKKYLLANQDQTINWRANLCLDWDHVARAFYPSDENLARERRLMEIAYEDKENFDPKELHDIMMFYLKTFYPNSEFLKPKPIAPPVNTKKNRHSIHWSLMDLIGTMVVYGELLTQGKTVFEHEAPKSISRNVVSGTFREALDYDCQHGGSRDVQTPGFLLQKGKRINLGKMPHLLVAGTTGSGKSVFLESMIIYLIMYYKPSTYLILFDPKMVELSRFSGMDNIHPYIRELVNDDVCTKVEQMKKVLEFLETEMNARLDVFRALGVRDIKEYWKHQGRIDYMKRIVLFFDEFADVSMQAGKEFSERLGRIAAKSRAAGIHLVLATQKPTRDVVNPIIKANVPGRVAFRVACASDSRVILDENGAELLRGAGDGIFKHPEYGTIRFKGLWAGDEAVRNLVRTFAPPKPTVRECTPEYLEKTYWRMLVDMRWIMDCLHFPDVKLGKR